MGIIHDVCNDLWWIPVVIAMQIYTSQAMRGDYPALLIMIQTALAWVMTVLFELLGPEANLYYAPALLIGAAIAPLPISLALMVNHLDDNRSPVIFCVSVAGVMISMFMTFDCHQLLSYHTDINETIVAWFYPETIFILNSIVIAAAWGRFSDYFSKLFFMAMPNNIISIRGLCADKNRPRGATKKGEAI